METSVPLARLARGRALRHLSLPRMPGHSRSRGLLALLAAGVLLAIALGRGHPFVDMTNDHQGRALFAPGALHAGVAAEAGITLGNDGALPYDYSVRTSGGLPPGTRVRITEAGRGTPLYDGPAPRSEAPLGALDPGQRISLTVEIRVPSGARFEGGSPAFIWSAAATGWSGWQVAVLVLINVLGLAVLANELRRPRPRPAPGPGLPGHS
ncbi:MAG: hypothetical protein ACREPA_10880 [Candidatus Dormibacteraceae bacterium]